jgi:putative phosphoserine phosphatase/1-acylglycerol-3-phosphate O-acyltransferase
MQRGERLAFGLFDLVGETLPSILAARQAARAARGWSVASVAAAAEEIAPELDRRVEPFARQAIEDHRRAGRRVVLATTTPHDLIEPFAARLGFDEVLATRYRTIDDPDRGLVYAGSIDGEFVWSQGKARSVEVWARANRVELADSYAYSDSIFDLPMLNRVGHPVAVNPDPRLLAYATLRRWPRVWFNAPPGVPKPIGVELQDLIAAVARPELLPWLDIDVRGLSNLPSEGGFLLAANHRSYLDPLVVAYAMASDDRAPRFLAKKEVTDTPLVGPLVTALGAIRVDRGSGSDRPLVEAADALRAGELVVVFPQGTIPRGHDFFDPQLRGRHGAARLARETGVPIVPVGLWGTEKAWPRNARLPYVMNLADPPTVTIQIGEPYRPTSDDADEATAELMARIVDLLPDEARQEIEPTEAQLAKTRPASSTAT